ncbi:MAG: DUF1186 domain-containing protein [Terracidiphilus sp.]
MICVKRSREEVVAYFQHLFQTLECTPSEVWEGLALACTNLWPDELMDDLHSAWKDGLIAPGMISWKKIKGRHALGKDACMGYMREKYRLITDVTKEMAWRACFGKDRKVAYQEIAVGFPESPLTGNIGTITRAGPEVGRKDPCSCGSGKKFKKCCGR